jgi:hypothetical protein
MEAGERIPRGDECGHGGQMMATKSESSGKKTRRKASTAPELHTSAMMAAASMGIDPDVRRQLVAAEAYFLAERRGFAAGHELEDWVTAEAAVDSRLQQMRVA